MTRFNNDSGQITKSFYKKDNDTIEFKRIVVNDRHITLQSGQIFYGEYVLTHQRFTNTIHFNNDNRIIDSLISSISNQGLKDKLVDEKDVMFIQIVPDSAM